ncbi:MAG: RHS repeat-associated core domain-containing protein [Bacteroidota bacterium]
MSQRLILFQINYNTVENCFNYTGTALYNGNISETYWRTASDNVERKYGYKYDNVNRLRESIYQKPGIIIAQTLVTNAYDENITYDKNGNITSLQRNGNGDPQIGAMPIDDLTYVYMPNSPNQLLKVTDSPNGNDAQGFIDANKTDDYTYDDNGNLTTDKKKEITNITYNYFNLPTEITFRNDISNTIRYIYDALGTKLKKIVLDNGNKTETCYAGSFQYIQDFVGGGPSILKFFSQPEGYVEPSGSSFKYVYQYKDHLGNVRLSYGDSNNDEAITNSEIIEESNYYPFGLKHNGYNPYTPTNNKYKFNGKELQDELQLGMYTYGFRDYDPAIGRWIVIDPLAEKSRRWSPYNYCVDNPVRFIDPDGREIINIEGGVRFTGNDAKLAFSAIKQEIKETGGVKIHLVDEAVTPNIYRHTVNSLRKGKPDILHYDSDLVRRNERRKDNFAKSGLPTKTGYHRDEFPYASTFEGANADVAYVPATENLSQGGSLGALYKTMKHGESFLVFPRPKDKEPDAVPDSVPDPVPFVNPNTVKKAVPAATATATILTIIGMIILAPVGI